MKNPKHPLRRAFLDRDLEIPRAFPAIPIFDPKDAQAALTAAGYRDGSDPAHSDNERSRLEALARLANDDGRRPAYIATNASLAALSELQSQCPGFERVIDVWLGAAHLSQRLQRPFLPPPMVLVGPPGCGKTRFVNALEQALASSLSSPPATSRIACNLVSDAFMLVGHPTSWKSAKQGELTRALVSSPCAQILIVLDEIDKLSAVSPGEEPHNILLSLLEPENACRLKDELLEIPFDLSHALVIATANDISALPDPLQDRFLVVEITPPSAAQRASIACAIHAEIAGNAFGPLDNALCQCLAAFHPRAIRRILNLALGDAAKAGSVHVTEADLVRAIGATSAFEKPRIGFLDR